MHVLRSVCLPSSPQAVVAAQLAPAETHLAVARQAVVEVYKFDPKKPAYLVSQRLLQFPLPVDALAVIPAKLWPGAGDSVQTDTLAVLAANTLHLVRLVADTLQIIHRVTLANVEGQGRCTETPPLMVVLSGGKYLYLVMHVFQGFVTAVDLQQIFSTNDDAPRKAKRARRNTGGSSHARSWTGSMTATPGEARVARTYNIGQVAVQQIVAVPGKEPTFALLYRDIEFNYSLRHYSFASLLHALVVSRQMLEFSDAPLLAFAALDGVVVASDLHMYYFPNSGQVEEYPIATTHDVTRNSENTVMTLGLYSDYLGASFSAHVALDLDRHLLVSDMGHTLLLTLSGSVRASTTRVTWFKVEDVGLSTVASSLAYLGPNVVFAASRLSRSLLFQLKKGKGSFGTTTVRVLAFLPSSPPVLDMHAIKGQDGLVVAQGGLHSGELVVRTLQQFAAVNSTGQTRSADAKAFQITYAGRDKVCYTLTREGKKGCNGEMYFWKLKDILAFEREDNWKEHDWYKDKDQDNELLENTQRLNDTEDLDEASDDLDRLNPSDERNIGKTYFSDGFVYLEGTFFVLETNILRKIPLPFEQPASLSVFEEEDAVHFIVLLWCGRLCWIISSDEGLHIYLNTETSLKGHVSAAIYPLSNEENLLVAVDGTGNFEQQLFVGETLKNKISTKIEVDLDTLFRYRNEKKLFLRSSRKIYLLHPSDSPFLSLSFVTSTQSPMLDCQLIPHPDGKNRFLIVYAQGRLESLVYQKLPLNHNTFFSDKLVLQAISLERRNVIVAILLELKPNKSTGKMDKLTSIVLYDRKTLQVYDTVAEDPGSNFVGLCALGSGSGLKDGHFVAVCKSDYPSKLFPIFKVQGTRIVKFALPQLEGSYPKPLTAVKVKCYDGVLHVIGNRYITLELDMEDDQFIWTSRFRAPHCTLLTFGVDVVQVGGQVFIADVSRGLLTYNAAKDEMESMKTVCSPYFITVLASFQDKLLIYGDSAGNIGALSVRKGNDQVTYEQKFGFNVGDQVNTICVKNDTLYIGTSGGGIFRVDDVEISPTLASVYEKKSTEARLLVKPWKTFDDDVHEIEGIYDGDFLCKEMMEGSEEEIRNEIDRISYMTTRN